MAAQPVMGIAGALAIEYKWHLLVVGCVVRLDTADAGLRPLRPLRGRFEIAWLQQAVRIIASFGVFSRRYSSLEHFLLHTMTVIKSQAVFPPGLILDSTGYIEDFAWVPGVIGPLAAQPWACELTFGDYIDGYGADARNLFQMLFECAPFYVRAQVADASGAFQITLDNYYGEIQAYSTIRAGRMNNALAIGAFGGHRARKQEKG